jgi:hypothetical protein
MEDCPTAEIHAPSHVIPFGHLLMDNATASDHPFHVASTDHSAVTDAVAVCDPACQDVGDRLNAAMRMPRKSRQIILGDIVAKVVEQ